MAEEQEHLPDRGPAGLLEYMLDAFAFHRVVVDAEKRPIDYVFLEVNAAFEAETGLRRADIVGRRVTEVLPGIAEDPADWIGRFGRVGVTGEPMEFENHSQPLERWYQGSAYCPAPMHFAVCFRNVTEQKRAAARQLQLIAELEHKNAEMERFAYAVSHDLRSPLITIRSFAESLAESLDRGDMVECRADLQRIDQAASRLQGMLADLVSLARVGLLPEPTDAVVLTTVAQEVVELLAGVLTPRGIEVQVPPDMPAVRAPARRVAEVLLNLVENAARFMGDAAQPCITLEAKQVGADVWCAVHDNGIGIEPRHQGRLFEPFYQLDPAAGGAGFGLALVRRIISAYGGRVWVESPGRGQGATFWFTLPAA